MTTPAWAGVFPAVTTQFRADLSLDIEGNIPARRSADEAGVHGLIFLGSVGENTTLDYEEKLTVLREMKALVNGRIPVLTGVAETTTALASRYAADAERIGIDGLMVLPAMIYKADRRETIAHFRTVARATGLPIMVYNNPVRYGVDMTPDMFVELADEPTFVAIKESSDNVRRITDIVKPVGDRYTSILAAWMIWCSKASLLGRRVGCRDWSTRSRTRTVCCGTWRPPAGGARRARFIAGTRRCSTSIRSQSWSSTSSWHGRVRARQRRLTRPPGCPSWARSAKEMLAIIRQGDRDAAEPAPLTRARCMTMVRRIQVIDSHTGGEPTRVVVSAAPTWARADGRAAATLPRRARRLPLGRGERAARVGRHRRRAAVRARATRLLPPA